MATYFRGWAISGSQVYFQLYNNGPPDIQVSHVSVSSSVPTSGVLLLFTDPLGYDLTHFGAGNALGIDGNNQYSQYGEVRASVGEIAYGGQLDNFAIPANQRLQIPIDMALSHGRGIGFRIVETGVVRFGCRWQEPTA